MEQMTLLLLESLKRGKRGENKEKEKVEEKEPEEAGWSLKRPEAPHRHRHTKKSPPQPLQLKPLS